MDHATPRLTTIQHVKKLLCIGVIVYDPAADFRPGVTIERHFVHADNHLRRKPKTSQQTDQNACALQAQRPFRMPGARPIHCGTRVRERGVVGLRLDRDVPTLDSVMDGAEAAELSNDFIREEQNESCDRISLCV
jgi:hypothetical protein